MAIKPVMMPTRLAIMPTKRPMCLIHVRIFLGLLLDILSALGGDYKSNISLPIITYNFIKCKIFKDNLIPRIHIHNNFIVPKSEGFAGRSVRTEALLPNNASV